MRSTLIIIIISALNIPSLSAQIDAFIESEMTQRNIPGLAACVVKNQEIVWSNAYGTANFDTNTPVQTNTLFTVASISKLFVATALMQAYEAGLIDLDTDINNYLDFDVVHPDFPNTALTARMLLRHRAGIRDPEGDMYDYWTTGDYPGELGDFLENIITPTGNNYQANYFSPNHAPSSSTFYSNIGFSLLALMVEQVNEQPFHAYCKENIFDPLCMDNTTFWWADVDQNNAAMPYDFINGQHVALDYYSIALYPSALIKTNVTELANFLLAYTGRGIVDGVQILESSSVDLLTPYDFNTENLGWWNGTSWTFTFHFPDDEVWFHGGYMPGIRARLNYYPDNGTGIIILTNGEGQYGFIEEELAANIVNFATDQPLSLPCNTTSIADVTNSNVQVYPSPSDGVVHIEGETIQSLEIFDMQGKKVLFKHNENYLRLNINYEGMIQFKIQTISGEIIFKRVLIL